MGIAWGGEVEGLSAWLWAMPFPFHSSLWTQNISSSLSRVCANTSVDHWAESGYILYHITKPLWVLTATDIRSCRRMFTEFNHGDSNILLHITRCCGFSMAWLMVLNTGNQDPLSPGVRVGGYQGGRLGFLLICLEICLTLASPFPDPTPWAIPSLRPKFSSAGPACPTLRSLWTPCLCELPWPHL